MELYLCSDLTQALGGNVGYLEKIVQDGKN